MIIPDPDPAVLIKNPKNIKKVRKLIAGIKRPGCIVFPKMIKEYNDYVDKIKKELAKMDETDVLEMLNRGLWVSGGA